MAIPRPERAATPEELLRYEAVALFAERAAAAVPGFALDEENARDVARICFRLDGLPLAIELAAARLGGLGTSTLADRLDDRFRLLQGGTRTAPSRQQTLLATLEWSHELLGEDERVLLRRLSVFAGGFDVDAVETVCADAELAREATVDVLARLVEKSLVAVSGGRELRYRLLETVRLYAGERLAGRRRGGRAIARAGAVGARARRARRREPAARRRGGEPARRARGARARRAAPLLHRAAGLLDAADRPRGGAPAARGGARGGTRADGAAGRGADRDLGDRLPVGHARLRSGPRRGEPRDR